MLELGESIVGSKLLNGLELVTSGAARPHEVGMVGVGEAIRTRARLRYDSALLECEDRLRRAHDREQGLDRLPALRIGDGMCRALGDGKLDPILSLPHTGTSPSRATLCVARGEEIALPTAIHPRETLLADTPPGSTRGRPRVAAAVRAGRGACRSHQPCRVRGGRECLRLHAADSGSPGRTRGDGRCGSPSGCRCPEAARTLAARQRRCRDRGARPTRPPNEDAGCRPSGRAPRARPAGRRPDWAQFARAPRAHPRR